MRSPCLMTSRSTRRASGLDRSTRYFSQYRGECASVRIWSSASDSAVRSPFFAASFKSSSSLAWLIRDGRARAISASLRRAATQPDLVAFTVRVVRLNGDLPVERARQPLEPFLAVTLKVPRQLGMHAHDDLATVRILRRPDLGPHDAEDLGGERRVGLRDAAPLARRARRREQRPEILAHALARHLDEAQLGDLEHVRPRLVLGQRALERALDLLAVLGRLHVDEIDDDDAAQVTQADLADDLPDGLEVDLEHGLLEVALADVLAGVHVDRDERFGMVDDDVPTGLEPDTAPERFLDVLLDPDRVEDRGGLLPQPHAVPQRRHERLDVAGALVVHLARVDAEFVDLRRGHIAHDAEGQGALLVQYRRRRRLLEAALDLRPEARQELHVGREFARALALGVRPQNEAAPRQGRAAQRRAEPVAFPFVTDASRDADVPGLRHVDEIAPGQRDEGGDPRPLGAERFLGDLHQDVLLLVEQLLDRRGIAARLELLDVHVGLALLVAPREHHAGEVAEVRRVIAGVQEGVLLQPDVDERGLRSEERRVGKECRSRWSPYH